MSDTDNLNDLSPRERDALEQQLLELHFDCHTEPDALRERLRREPALRALHKDVLKRASVLTSAAHDEGAHLTPRLASPTLARRLLPWLAPFLAAATVLIAASFWGYAAWNDRQLSESDVMLELTTNAGVDGRSWFVSVAARDGTGTPLDVPVTVTAFDAEDAEIDRFELRSRPQERAPIVQAGLNGPRRIVAVAHHNDHLHRVEATIDPFRSAPLTHLQIDKPIYRPGETLRARGVALHRRSLAPSKLLPQLRFRVTDLDGKLLDQLPTHHGDDELAAHGVHATAWTIPDTVPGGRYRLEWFEPHDALPTTTESFAVRRFAPPRLDKKVTLDRATYAPGSAGIAEIAVQRLGGDLAAHAEVRAALVIDGDEIWAEECVLDRAGRARVAFTIPTEVARGDARFVARITDGGTRETVIEPFAVPTGALDVALYPEGGDLVAGLESRVYVSVTDSLGRPTSASGAIRGPNGDTVARFVTEHAGRARFRMTPRAGLHYDCVLDGATNATPLPAAVDRGLVLASLDDTIAAGAPLRLRHASVGRSADWTLGVFCRGACIAQRRLPPSRTPQEIAVDLPPEVFGVLRVTAFDEAMQPWAERLVQRAASESIQLEVGPAADQVAPGTEQSLRIVARDASGTPLPNTALGVIVSDGAVRALAGEPRLGLLDRASLFGDVTIPNDLAEYLPAADRASLHVDLLLGSLGWRRFAWTRDPQTLRAAETGTLDARRLAALPFDGNALRDTTVTRPYANWRELQRAHQARSRAARTLRGTATASVILLFVYALVLGAVFVARHIVGYRSLLGDVAVAGLTLGAVLVTVAVVPMASGLPEPVGRLWEIAEDAAPRLAKRELAADGEWVDDRNDVAAADGARLAARRPDERSEEDELIDTSSTDQPRRHARLARVYAHRRSPAVAGDARSDFTEAVMWDALVITNENGTATCTFDTSDRITTWNIDVDAHGHGLVGQAHRTFDTSLPFSMDISLPNEVTEGDHLELPVAFALTANVATREPVREVELSVRTSGNALRHAGSPRQRTRIEGGRGALRIPLDVVAAGGSDATIDLVAQAGAGLRDAVHHRLRVVPRGFPHRRSWAGTVAREAASFTVPMPADLRPQSARITLRAFPSPVAMLRQGLDGIVQEPHGCFEQASSSNYPNTMVLAYLEASGDVIPSVRARAAGLMPRGYEKIAGYECSRRGYEWFGSNPGHEALTAYGLLQFTDMQRVYDGVDASMLQRTQDWLLQRRDGSGGFKANDAALDSFGHSPSPTTNAYATYALLYSGTPASTLRDELAALARRARSCPDAYELAIAACALELGGEHAIAATTRRRLVSMQREDGGLAGSTTTITHSGGRDLEVETTSFAVLAWLADPARRHIDAVQRACTFLHSRQTARGIFGATQATIMALKALTEQARVLRSQPQPGELVLFVDEVEVARRRFSSEDRDPVDFDVTQHLATGGRADVPRDVRLVAQFDDPAISPSPIPWACDLEYRSDQPADDPDGVIGITTQMARSRVAHGDVVALRVEISNRSAESQPMALAKVGIPASLNVPTAVLDALRDAGRFDLWEIQGRTLALYWRSLVPHARNALTLDCVATIPGRTTGPASSAGLYYTPDMLRWAPELTIEVE